MNHLKLNDSKTEFLTLGTKHNLSQLENVFLKIGDEDIPSASSSRNIGVLFDETMDMKEQVSQITHSCYTQLCSIP